MIQGTCKVFNGKVVRIMEFGEDEDFCEKVDDLRKSIRKEVINYN